MKKILSLLVLLLVFMVADESNTTKKFDIDKEIEKIMAAPQAERRHLMNELKRKIFELNLDIQSSQIIHLQKILRTPLHTKGKH